MPDPLTVQLVNQTTSPNIFAFITGLAIHHHMARVFILPDSTPHYPASPPPGKILQPLTTPCAIPLGAPGNTVTLTIPPIAGGRIWFSAATPLTFLRNPGGPGGGAALVEPSVLNPTDPNAAVDFAFCEFTRDAHQLFANVSYVDFVPRLPVALTLLTEGGAAVQHVSGLAGDGLRRVCEGLRAQGARDGWPWGRLVVEGPPGGEGGPGPLRALSPTHGAAVGARFEGFFEPLVEAAWRRYAERPGETPRRGLRMPMVSRGPDAAAGGGHGVLRINTQAAPGVLEGRVAAGSDELVIGGEAFARPTTADILGCNSGPFTTGPSPKRNAIIPRLAAAFQRGCIADVDEHPSAPETFYRSEPSNHYSQIVHECSLDGKGYAFAYDDVQPDGGADQSGKVNAGDPKVFIVAVGGGGAYVGDRMP
ncbi:glycoside hydrolase family 64 protein [Trichocladium antarcticum]|uniref:Glycoside hydrolase family 64 protein n=1 Tax=Trichocladium antarcticum TaxID=1450529 RepID=A0AAN6ZGM1_9PEZI|nr:glycoside hydrolase family 64 protein [Trichocladium antarcticum]